MKWVKVDYIMSNLLMESICRFSTALHIIHVSIMLKKTMHIRERFNWTYMQNQLSSIKARNSIKSNIQLTDMELQELLKTLLIYFRSRYYYHCHTWCIAHAFSVSKTNSNSQAQYHQYPIDLGYINLTMEFGWSVDNFHPREATQSRTLFDDRESSSDDGLASYHCSKYGDY